MRDIAQLLSMNESEMGPEEIKAVQRHVRDTFQLDMVTCGWGDLAHEQYDLEMEKLYNKAQHIYLINKPQICNDLGFVCIINIHTNTSVFTVAN